MEKQSDRVKAFWDARAELKEKAGTDDLIAKWLEMRLIADRCRGVFAERKTRNVLDAGCGNGMTLIDLACEMDISAVGMDSSAKMVKEARAAWRRQHCNSKSIVDFQVNDMLEMKPHDFPSKFDFAYTERTLINLPDWESQERAIRNVLACVKRGGVFLMVENSADGLAGMNLWRMDAGLDLIVPPWHNRYLVDAELKSLGKALLNEKVANLEAVRNYSSTYYFLSRVVNALLAKGRGEEPDYLSDVNKLALVLPAMVNGFIGQGRAWTWRKL